MKVILTQAVPGVGEAGTIKEVADGYARNYLLPRKMAIVATRGSVKQAEAQVELYARKANKARSELEKAAAGIQDKTVIIRARAGSENRLYGSVTAADIADALQAQHGLNIDRRKIELDEAIHRLGSYTATADVGGGIIAKFNVEVAPEVAGASGSGKAAKASAAKESSTEEPADLEANMDAGAEALSEERTETETAEQQAEANPS